MSKNENDRLNNDAAQDQPHSAEEAQQDLPKDVTANENDENDQAHSSNHYFRLIENLFPTVRIDLLSGDLMVREYDGSGWKSIFSTEIIETLKTFAAEQKLDRGLVKSYLHRYARELRQQGKSDLLIDIPEWGGEDVLATFANGIHSSIYSHEQIEEILKEWFANIFLRLENPKVDNVCLIFSGRQGVGKEVLIRALTSGFGQFTIPFQYQGQQKDILQALHTGVVVHIEEFDHIAEKLPAGFMKMLITTPNTLFRAAYGKAQQMRQARWSLIASCNRDDFLRDTTGNRRFVIIPVDKIDGVLTEDRRPLRFPSGLIDYPMSEGLKILAQARELAKQEFKMSLETKAIITSHIESLTPLNPEKEFLEEFLRYVATLQPGLKMVKGCFFVPVSDHDEQILMLARRYKLKNDWAGIRNLLGRNGINTNVRTNSERGIGVPPELLAQLEAPKVSDVKNAPIGANRNDIATMLAEAIFDANLNGGNHKSRG